MTAELKRPGWLEIIVGVVAFFLLLIPTAVMVGYLQDQPVLQGVVASTGGGTAGLGAFLLVYLLRIRSLAVFGFKSVSLRWLLAGAGLAVVGYGLSLLIQYGWLHFVGADQSQSVLHKAAQAGALAFTLSLIGGAVLTPLGEEFLFRGVVANALNRYGAWAGIGLSSVIFGLIHGVGVVLPVAIMVGVLSAILFRKTGSVWPCVVLHAVYNASQSLASALGSAPMQ